MKNIIFLVITGSFSAIQASWERHIAQHQRCMDKTTDTLLRAQQEAYAQGKAPKSVQSVEKLIPRAKL